MESVTHPISTPLTLGEYLLHADNRDMTNDILLLNSNTQASEICKSFRNFNQLLMQKMWREESTLLTKNPGDPASADKNERITNRLKDRMLAIVPEADRSALDRNVLSCYTNLLTAQSRAVYGSTIQSKIDAFEDIQQRYGPSFSFKRFRENEALIDDTLLEMDRNLELAWPRILQTLNVALPSPPPNARQIEAWIDDPANGAFWERAGNLLNLQRLSLTNLPKQIYRLTRLTELYLARNLLTDLPTEFSALNRLKILGLSSNQLKHIPPVVCQLAQLDTLNLSSNELSDLPPRFENIDHLRSLNLDDNRFTEIPSVIVRLTELHQLWISNNQIQVLPTSLTNPYQMNLSYFIKGAGDRWELGDYSNNYLLLAGGEEWDLRVSNNPIRSIHCTLDNSEMIDMDHVEEIEVTLQDWIVSRLTLPRLDINYDDYNYVLDSTEPVMKYALFLVMLPITVPSMWLRQFLSHFHFLRPFLSRISESYQHLLLHLTRLPFLAILLSWSYSQCIHLGREYMHHRNSRTCHWLDKELIRLSAYYQNPIRTSFLKVEIDRISPIFA
jgi:hypothetical protein